MPWHRQHGRAEDDARERGACRLTDGLGDGGRIKEKREVSGSTGASAEAGRPPALLDPRALARISTE